MNAFLHDKRFPKYLRRTTDLKDAQCAQPASLAGVHILVLADDPTFCQNVVEEVQQGLKTLHNLFFLVGGSMDGWVGATYNNF